MIFLLRLHIVTVAIATSYVALGIFSPHDAGRIWAPYAAVMLTLAIANLIMERKHLG